MRIYVAIDLADERHCDGCPVRFDGRDCLVFEAPTHTARPQACIDASAEIDKHMMLYEFLKLVRITCPACRGLSSPWRAEKCKVCSGRGVVCIPERTPMLRMISPIRHS